MSQQARQGSEFESTMLLSTETVSPDILRNPDNDPLIGAVLADAYRIDEVIGEGGMGRLYRARHLRLERPFAVKVIHHPLSQREDLRARFEREARVMSCVRSDQVVDIVDVVHAADGRTCIVSEFLEGQDLEQHLMAHGGKLPQAEAVHLMRQCLWGLSAAHAKGVVHRDLKPSNLFVVRSATGRPILKILDFGVAKSGADSEMTGTGIIVGTPAYMAPEQARGASLADARSDLYAVGAVLYRMITGKSPYSESDAGGTLIRLMQEAPPRPSLIEPSIAPGLEAVIERAMARDRNQRYQTAEELEAALSPFDEAGSRGPSRTAAAKSLDRRARLVRPMAVLSGLSLVFAATVSVATMLAMLVHGLSSRSRMNTTEYVLVLLGATVAGCGSAMAVWRSLTSAWANVAVVQAHTSLALRTLLGGFVVLGVLELGTAVARAFELAPEFVSAPLWAAGRVLVAVLVACGLTLTGAGSSKPARAG